MPEKYEYYKEGKEPIPNDLKARLPFHGIRHLGAFVYYFYITFSMEARRERFFRRMFAGSKNKKILNIGCGGGWSFLNDYGHVTGLDISKFCGRQAKKYSDFLLGSCTVLPFRDESFDYVVSSDLIEHMPHHMKDQLWKETKRVVKKDGKMVHFISTDSDQWLMRLAKHDAKLYRKITKFRDHFRIEYPEKEIARIKKNKLKIIALDHVYKDIIGFGTVTMTCEPFKDEFTKRPIFRLLWKIDNPVHKMKPIRFFANMIVGVLADIFDRFSKNETGILVSCTK
jgi:ubiquinone/menaquinone biosynthesis C-methylase UbiE